MILVFIVGFFLSPSFLKFMKCSLVLKDLFDRNIKSLHGMMIRIFSPLAKPPYCIERKVILNTVLEAHLDLV